MRLSGPVTVSALMVAGVMVSGSAVHTAARPTAPARIPVAAPALVADSDTIEQVGLVPAAPEPPRKLRAMTTGGLPPFAGTVPLHDILLPGGGTLGIPEIVLAAYRNAELALQSSNPGCNLPWNLLAGIGKVESNHAGNGRTDANGTTVGVIYGPALDGTLPGNEVIRAADGTYVRAIGPMQFLPSTWNHYAADAKGDGHPDPNNVFDAALAAGKYLCSGGEDLRDPAQELRAVLRYNNSLAYASQVLSWSTAYRTGGAPVTVAISPDLVPPGTNQIPTGPDMVAVNTLKPTPEQGAPAAPSTTTATVPAPVMINIPGLPPIPCGIFCPPPPPDPCNPGLPPRAASPNLPAQLRDWMLGRTQQAPGAADPNNPGAPVAATTDGDPAADPNAQPGDPNAQPGDSHAQPGDPNAQPADPNAQPGDVNAQPGDPNAKAATPPAAPAGCAPQAAAPAPTQPGTPGDAGQQPAAPALEATPETTPDVVLTQDAPAPEAPAAAPTQAPGFTLPFGIVIPLPAPPQ
ncbi:lytic transglycosylase domain-containing protein [Nocardia stercoris]|uniref:Lytic transglycosylase n=1 Tax=Nocardia stercoris TaxID=2483361 RepID=A0A3M2LBX6_9NOCA|nr:lytic murein transglycosylase [Nocardia stercoris]RMI35027.1 lytic transglycosylase [Nocardia stercoris]